MLRSVLWLVLFAIGLIGVVLPIVYFYEASGLPPLATRYDIEKQLRNYIEAERRVAHSGIADQEEQPVDWARPDFNDFPQDLVAIYISQMGCPSYFQAQGDGPVMRAWRSFDAALFGGLPSGASARCEYFFALHLARALSISGEAQQAIAAYQIRSSLQKADLLAFDLASQHYADGVIGIRAASQAIFHRAPLALSLAQRAELGLVMAPHFLYKDVRYCANAGLIEMDRNFVLDKLAQDSLVERERVDRAKKQPVDCNNRVDD